MIAVMRTVITHARARMILFQVTVCHVAHGVQAVGIDTRMTATNRSTHHCDDAPAIDPLEAASRMRSRRISPSGHVRNYAHSPDWHRLSFRLKSIACAALQRTLRNIASMRSAARHQFARAISVKMADYRMFK
jgi:hypothetical protein